MTNEIHKYMKRPLEVEAIKFTGDKRLIERFLYRPVEETAIREVAFNEVTGDLGILGPGFTINNPAGQLQYKHGDYIVIGTQGECYVVDGEIFKQTYEPTSGPFNYVKRPVEVEAMQYNGSISGVVLAKKFTDNKSYLSPASDEDAQLYVTTLEGDAIVNEGDYIVKGTQGECYPVPEDTFNEIYEIVEGQRPVKQPEALFTEEEIENILNEPTALEHDLDKVSYSGKLTVGEFETEEYLYTGKFLTEEMEFNDRPAEIVAELFTIADKLIREVENSDIEVSAVSGNVRFTARITAEIIEGDPNHE